MSNLHLDLQPKGNGMGDKQAPQGLDALRQLPASVILAMASLAGAGVGGTGVFYGGGAAVDGGATEVATKIMKEHNDTHHARIEDRLDEIFREISNLKIEVHSLVVLEERHHGRD